MKKLFFCFSIVFLGINHAQAQDSLQTKYTASQKGKVFFYWGWNRAHYSNSDITFSGDDYDFTLYNVTAKDNPTGIHMDYINPTRLTIPQTNFRLGYFITDKYYLSLGQDHMKYVMVQDQTVRISGYNNVPGFEIDSNTKQLSPNFLTFEHTDGLNYINAEIGRFDDITPTFITNTDKLQLNALYGVGTGILLPRTNTELMNFDRYDEFHLAGFGLGVKAGLNLTFLKYFFVQTEIKGGYINMPDIRTTMNTADRASQEFYFFQQNIVFGGIFKI